MRPLEKIVDDSGWVFYMPRIDYDDIDRLGLGTWDLADWTFGTMKAMFPFYEEAKYFTFLERVFWRLENILRLLEWIIFLRELEYEHTNKKIRYLVKIIRVPLSKMRHLIFNIAWKVSEMAGWVDEEGGTQ